MGYADSGTICIHDPEIWTAANAFDTDQTWQLNAAGNKVGLIFSVRKTGNISKVGLLISSFTTGAQCKVGLYTVDSNGLPTTTLYGGSNYGTFTPTAATYYEVTLGTAAAAAAGDMVAIVIEFVSTAGNFNLSGLVGGSPYQIGTPYSAKYTTSWARSSRYTPVAASVGYSDGSYPRSGIYPITSKYSGSSYNLNSSPNEYALQFTPNYSCRVIGIWTACYGATVNSTCEISLYLGTTRLTYIPVSNLMTSYTMFQEFYFLNPQILTPSNTYYAAVKATSSTDGINLGSYGVLSAASTEAIGFPPGWSVKQATRPNNGSWTSTVGTIPVIGLLVDQVNDGTSNVISGMNRGAAVNGL